MQRRPTELHVPECGAAKAPLRGGLARPAYRISRANIAGCVTRAHPSSSSDGNGSEAEPDLAAATPAAALDDCAVQVAELSTQEEAPRVEASVAVPAPAAAAPPSQPPAPAAPLGSEGSWVLALAVVFAARLGRVTAQEARLDVRRLQRDRERSRALSTELLAAREAWRVGEGERSAQEDARRVEESMARSREEARRQAERQRKYQEDAARDSERLRAERDAARAAYEAEQAALDAEYQSRVEAEARALEAARERARREEDARRAAAEAAAAREAEARRAREAAAQAAREAAVRQKLEERRRLETEKQRFAVRLEGKVWAGRPPKGTLLPGPLQKEATLRVAVAAGSLLGGAGDEVATDFGSVGDAREALPAVVAQAARAAAAGAASALRLQGLTGQGALTAMDEPELQHWMSLAAGRTAVAALRAGEEALHTAAAGPSAAAPSPPPVPFQVRTEFGVLPAGHPQSSEAVLGRAVALIEAGEADRAVDEVLADVMEADNEAFYSGLDPLPAALLRSPRLLGSSLALAHLLGRMLNDRPARTSDAPAWFEGAAALVRTQMAAAAAGAPPDSLQAPAAVLAAALGPQNPVALEAAALAEANVSAAQRAQRAERERAQASALAEKLLAEEWPDEGELRAARAADRDSKTPVPERVWALRNVAGSLALGGPGERARARALLEQAVLLKQRFAGGPDHPGVLPELVALETLLSGEPAWAGDAAGVAALVLRSLGRVAEGYARGGDPASAAVLLEAALRRYEEAAGVRSQAARALTRRADAAAEALTPEQRSAVAAQRSRSAEVVAKVCEALTEKLGAYQESAAKSRSQEWDERGAALVGPLLVV